MKSMTGGFKNKRRERKGVAAVIGGVILTGILLTSVLTYFIVILDNDRARKSYEISAANAAQDQSAEEFSVLNQENLVGTDLTVRITNDGSLPIVVSQVVLYCTAAGCPSSEPDIDSTAETLNAKEESSRDVGPLTLTTGLTYRVDVISERGNIVSTSECTVDSSAGTCESDGDGSEGIEAIAQGTGSVQLDFESIAAIFPDFTTRNGIDQTGRFVSASDVQGYPSTNLYGDVNTIIVQRVRNLNDDNDLSLTKNTAMITAFGGTKGNHPKPVFICSTTDDHDPLTRTPITMPPTVYSNDIVLERVPFPYDLADGWKNIYFCRAGDGSGNPTGALNGWKPDVDYSLGINPIFMVMRAKILGTTVDYAQTIPYQAFQLNGANDGTIQEFVACSYGTTVSNANCQQQTAALGGSPPPYDYTLNKGDVNYIHISHSTTGANQGLGTSPYTIELIHPDGSITSLASGATLDPNRNIPITIDASTDTSLTNYFTIKVTDSSDVAGSSQKTVFMTVQVT